MLRAPSAPSTSKEKKNITHHHDDRWAEPSPDPSVNSFKFKQFVLTWRRRDVIILHARFYERGFSQEIKLRVCWLVYCHPLAGWFGRVLSQVWWSPFTCLVATVISAEQGTVMIESSRRSSPWLVCSKQEEKRERNSHSLSQRDSYFWSSLLFFAFEQKKSSGETRSPRIIFGCSGASGKSFRLAGLEKRRQLWFYS